jgi:outer membrane protein OmpA-like peptidoglycan-associated protein
VRTREIPLTRHRYIPMALAMLTSVALGACGGSSKSSSTSDRAGKQPTTRSTTKTATAPVASRPLVTVDAYEQEPGLHHSRISIYDLRREGPYVVLDFGLVCEESTSTGCGTRFPFALPGDTGEASNGFNEASGVTLVDPTSDKQYGVVHDAQLNPQASALPYDSIRDNSLHLAWVKFPAPPPTTRTLDVVFPGGGPQIPNVPLSDTAARLPTNLGPDGTPQTRGDNGAQPADSTSTAGMTLPVTDLITTAGNAAGSDAESPRGVTITLRTDVLFKFAKSTLTPLAKAILGPLAAKIKSRAAGPVQVTGYTDSIGTDQVNIPLSRARAASVVAVLRPALPGTTFHAGGLGSSDPVAPNTKRDGSDNPGGRALNRRVTISFPVNSLTAPTAPAPAADAPSAPSATARTVDYTQPGQSNHWQVTVNGLYREGNLAVMKLGITCTHPAGQDCNAAEDFIGTQSVPPADDAQNWLAQGPGSFWTLGGFYLTDPITGTDYIPVYQGAGDPLTAPVSSHMPAGQTYPVWIYLSAPPPSTTTVTISLPGGSPKIGDVPITDAASPAGG